MSLESFFHEVAMRQASSDRDHLKLAPPRWKRSLAALPPAAKRFLALTALAALAAAGWWWLPLINQYLLSSSSHPPGAADVLASVTRRAPPLERARRLVLACARENDAHACQVALQQALTFAPQQVVAAWLKEKEVHALRVNAYFEQFAAHLENSPERLNPPAATPTRAEVPPSQPRAPETRAAQTGSSPASLPTNLPARPDGSGFLSKLPATLRLICRARAHPCRWASRRRLKHPLTSPAPDY